MALFGLFPTRRRPHERAAFALYTAAVTAARGPWLFGEPGGVGVPDTLPGRFEAVGLHVALLVRRLRTDPDPRGPALAQAVFDAMFADMDGSLREMGIGDMSIGKRVKRLWEAWHGRALAYEAALDAGAPPAAEEGDDPLADALARNVWAGAPPDATAARRLAAHARAVAEALAGQTVEALAAGRVTLPHGAAAVAEAVG